MESAVDSNTEISVQENPLLSNHPQQNSFSFDSITISSKFDSGNLSNCILKDKNTVSSEIAFSKIFFTSFQFEYTNDCFYFNYIYLSSKK
jgi:hypothetical protein